MSNLSSEPVLLGPKETQTSKVENNQLLLDGGQPLSEITPAQQHSSFQRWLMKRYRSYYWRHLICWVLLALVLSSPMYASGKGHLSYIDAFFYTTSSITATGLQPTDFSQESDATHILVFCFMFISGRVFESILPLIQRLWVIHRSGVGKADLEIISEEKWTCWTLLLIVSLYSICCQVFSFLALGFYFKFSLAGSAVMEANGANAWWFNLFQTVSSFQNCGLGLLSDSLIQLNQQIFPLFVYGLLIFFGNAGYPFALRLILRFICYVAKKFDPRLGDRLEVGFSNFAARVFPSYSATGFLAISLIGLTLLQTVLMCTVDRESLAFSGLSDGYVLVNALFQSTAVRTAGSNSILLSSLSVQSLVLFIIIMPLSVYPAALGLRGKLGSHKQQVRHQLQELLMRDLLWLFAGWYVICAIEKFPDPQNAFTVLFEVCSAYGTVGLSIGVVTAQLSFSGTLSGPSKLVLIFLMFIGRHRVLPHRFDHGLMENQYQVM